MQEFNGDVHFFCFSEFEGSFNFFSFLDWKHPFWVDLAQKSKIVGLI